MTLARLWPALIGLSLGAFGAAALASAQVPTPFSIWLPGIARHAVVGSKGSAVSGFNLQNVDATRPALSIIDLTSPGLAYPIPINLPPIGPSSAYNIYMPSESKLPDGIYGVVSTGDRPMAAIARTEWPATGGAASFSDLRPARRVAVPLFVRGLAGQQSHVFVQNTDVDHAQEVRFDAHPADGASAVYTLRQTLPAGQVAIMGAIPGLPASFLGWLDVTAAAPVALQSYVDIVTSAKAIYAFEGVPVEAAAATLYAPLVRNDFYGTTGISIVNPGTGPVEVTVRHAARWGPRATCEGREYIDGPLTISPGSSHVFYQGGSGTSLPPGCGGAATIEAKGGKILAIVNDATGDPARPTTAAAYNAPSADQAAHRVALPLIRLGHTAASLTTGIQAMNVGPGTARITIRFTLIDGSVVESPGCGACAQSIPAGGSYTWYLRSIAQFPVGKYGSAMIESDQPTVAIVNDVSDTGRMDAAMYNGIPVGE
jgi:hypothetical protein